MNVRSWAKYRLLLPGLAAVLGVLGLLSPAVMGEAEGAGAGAGPRTTAYDLHLRTFREGVWESVQISILVIDDGQGPEGEAATSSVSGILRHFPDAYVVNDDGSAGATFNIWHFWYPASVPWAYNSAGKPSFLSGELGALQAAANTWTNANMQFAFTGGGPTTRPSGGCFNSWDGHNTVGWGLLDSPSTLGVVCRRIKEGFTLSVAETDMLLPPDKNWTTSTTQVGYDLQSIALHEFGHMAGLDHPIYGECSYTPLPVMCPYYSQGTLARTLRADDLAGLKTIYIDIPATAGIPTQTVTVAPPTATPSWTPILTPTPTSALPPTFTPVPPPDPGGFQRRVTLPLLARDTGSGAPAATPTPYIPPTATPYFPPTATPYFPPTATPTIPFGGGLLCYGIRTTADWRIEVSPSYGWDLFEITITPLTDAAVASTFKVRVYDPGYGSYDSSTKYPYFIGQSIRLSYGSDFYRYEAYPRGIYEVELRVDFLRETSLYVSC